jgi:hypothetical protein
MSDDNLSQVERVILRAMEGLNLPARDADRLTGCDTRQIMTIRCQREIAVVRTLMDNLSVELFDYGAQPRINTISHPGPRPKSRRAVRRTEPPGRDKSVNRIPDLLGCAQTW